MKRVLQWVGVVVALLVVLAGGVWYSAFGNNKPIVEGTVVDGVQTVKDGFVNVFLVDAGPRKVALIDAGNDKSGGALLKALAARNLAASSVAAIFLTHGHGDHTAGCRLFPGAEVYAMEADVPLVGGAAKIAHPLHDGAIVNVGGLLVEAFSVPGHTPGSAVYLARGVLFFGDSAGASKTGTLMRAVRLFSKDPALNVASLTDLAGRLAPRRSEIKAMAFGHTGSLVGLDALTAFAAENP